MVAVPPEPEANMASLTQSRIDSLAASEVAPGQLLIDGIWQDGSETPLPVQSPSTGDS